jgi:hypothetical protein
MNAVFLGITVKNNGMARKLYGIITGFNDFD